MCCPFHISAGETHLSLNIHSGGHCHSGKCGKEWTDPLSFEFKYLNEVMNKKITWKTYLKRSYAKHVRPLVANNVIQYFHKELLQDSDKIQFLKEKRGIELNMIKFFLLGWDMNEDALTVPVENEYEHYIDCRKIRFNLPADQKHLKNLAFDWQLAKQKKANGERTHGKGGGLFPYKNVYKNRMFLCEGHPDCIVLNQHGFAGLTAGGVNAWKKWLHLLKNKDIVICFDNDANGAGQKAAAKLAKKLYPVNKSVVNVVMPKEGMDITDFFLAGYSADDLNILVESSTEEKLKQPEEEEEVKEDEIIKFNSLLDLCDPKNHGVTGTVTCKLTGKREVKYSIPTKIKLHCDMDFGKSCEGCQMQLKCGIDVYEIIPGSPTFLEMVDNSDRNIMSMFRPFSGAPTKCPNLMLSKENVISVQELIISPPLNRSKDTKNDDDISAISFVDNLELNADYDMTGMVTASPQGQQKLFAIFSAKLNEASHTNFKTPTLEKVAEYKKKFNPEDCNDPQSILKKHRELMEILAVNVTNIYGRPDLHTVIDLTLHSPLQMYMDGVLKNSYMDSIIVGDSNTGKNKVLENLSTYYNAGVIVDASSTSRAGLVAGISQQGFFSWGMFVQQHTKSIGVDEAENVSEMLKQLRAARDGKAEYFKVGKKAQTVSMTRAIWLSNDPRGPLSQNAFPIQALKNMIQHNPDITRFTLAYFMREEDTPHKLINSKNPEPIETDITKEDFQFKLSNAWAIKPEDIVVTDKAISKIYKMAEMMSKKYTSKIPLIQSSVQNEKIHRYAGAMAADLYHMNKKGTKLIVNSAFVEAACIAVMEHYDSDACGYLAYSEDVKKKATLYQMDKFDDEVSSIHTGNQGKLNDMYEAFLATIYITKDALELIVEGLTLPQKQQRVLTRLKKSRCIHNTINGWEKTKAFTTYLKEKLNE